MENYVITVSRQFGSFGSIIAGNIAKELGIDYLDRDIVEETARKLGEPVPEIKAHDEKIAKRYFQALFPLGIRKNDEIFQIQKNIIEDVANKKSCVIVGRCGNYILRNHPRALHLYIYAPYEAKLNDCIGKLGMSEVDARKMIKEVDLAREEYRNTYCPQFKSDFDGYDLMIDSSKFGHEGSVEFLVDIIRKRFETNVENKSNTNSVETQLEKYFDMN